MAIPTNPTGTSIVTEALKKSGIGSPSPDELTRAEDEWLEDSKVVVPAILSAINLYLNNPKELLQRLGIKY